MGKAWEEVAPQIWAFFQDGVQVKMVRVGYCVNEKVSVIEAHLTSKDNHRVD